jgi:hypothetical protein
MPCQHGVSIVYKDGTIEEKCLNSNTIAAQYGQYLLPKQLRHFGLSSGGPDLPYYAQNSSYSASAKPKAEPRKEDRPVSSSSGGPDLPYYVRDSSFFGPVQPKAEPKKQDRHQYLPATKSYIDGFNGKKKNSDLVQDLNLSVQEQCLFEECFDPTTFDIMNIPVRYNGNAYDLDTLIKLPTNQSGLRVDPANKSEFSFSDIKPAQDISNKIQSLLSRIQKQREEEAQAVVSMQPGRR